MGDETRVGEGGELRRPRLNARLAEATASRLTLITAGAGYGKTTMLHAWSGTVPTAWHTVEKADASAGTLAKHLVDALRLVIPDLSADLMIAASHVRGPDTDKLAQIEATAAALADAVDNALRRRVALVLDDVGHIQPNDESSRFLSALVRQVPSRLHVLVACRDRPPFPVARMIAHGDAVELSADELAFTAEETAALAEAVLGAPDPVVAESVRDLTGGWPVATRLALEALATTPVDRRTAAAQDLREPPGLLLDYITEEVAAHEDPALLDMLVRLEPLTSVNVDLASALGIDDARNVLNRAQARGIYLEPAAHGSGQYALAPLFRAYVAEHSRLADDERNRILTIASEWHEEAGDMVVALDYRIQLKDGGSCGRILAAHGEDLASAGYAQCVVDAARLVESERCPELETMIGDAHLLLGDWDAALRSYGLGVHDGGTMPARVAWRIGLLHYIQGDLDQALKAFDGSEVAERDRSDDSARALVLGWSAAVRWVRGDHETCRRQAAEALIVARASRDHRALACVHTIHAMLAALDGDRDANDAHYLLALDHASAAHDVFQLMRIHSNRASLSLETGDAEGTLVEVDLALRLADLAGFAFPRGVALSNRGQALIALGRLDEARADLEASCAEFDRLGSPMAAYAYTALGDLRRLRGDTVAAESAYRQALSLAEQVGNAQGLVPALAGLSRLLVAHDPREARQLAARAVGAGASLDRVQALIAAAEAAETLAEAERLARDAASEAHTQGNRAGLAGAWETLGRLTGDAPAVRQAAALWRELQNPIGLARAEAVLARLDPSPQTLARARRAIRHAVALGAHLPADESAPASAVAVRCLGGFAVLHRGEPVNAKAWQSRKARELLKILICRRGRPLHREQLAEMLWPDDPPEKTANRLSVALSTVRSVLDPDHVHPADHYITGEGEVVALRIGHIEVDVERFLAGARVGLAAVADGRADAMDELEIAETAYLGDLFEDDPYAEWAVDLREKARLTYLDVARRLAEHAARTGDHDARARYLLRILERDAYDEPAHLGLTSLLIEQGRHGEARRRYRLYCTQMEEIAVEAAPYPAIG